MDIPLDLDSQAALPLHRQVYEAVRAAILGGRLRPGDRLPPSRALAEQLSLSRATITEAYDQLQAEGYLQGKHGSGTYVAPNIPDELGTSGEVPSRTQPLSPFQTRLSPWGDRISGDGYRMLLRSSAADSFEFDFRPHQIARDLFPWREWIEAVDRALTDDRAQLLVYPPSAGHRGLREAIARHVALYRAVDCTADAVVIVNGSQQGINLLAHLLLRPGDGVAVEDPGYPTARLSFESQGLNIERIPVDAQGMVVDNLCDRPPCRLIHVTPSHQDPTGATLSLARRLALLDLAKDTRSVVLEDDYDSEFRYEGRPVESLQGLDSASLVVYAGTFSKAVLPGLRIGFLILPHHLIAPVTRAKSLWDGGSPMLEQAALAQFLVSGAYERHIRRMRRIYRSRRDAVIGGLASVFGKRATVGARHGGLNVLVTFHTEIPEVEFIRLAEHLSIGLRSAAAYYADPPLEPTFVMGFGGMHEALITEGIERLANVMTDRAL